MKALLLVMLLLGGDGFADGVRAYVEGRYRDALETFSAAEKADGEGASAELLYNKALAALRAGELREAESAAKKAAARGGPAIATLCDFLRGNIAFARCRKTEAEAYGPLALPTAFDAAIAHAEAASRAWELAAATRTDWLEARRNVERARLKLAELKRKKEAAEQQTMRLPDPQPLPKAEDQGDVSEEETDIDAQLRALTPEQIESLFEKLDEKEKEKLALRRARRRQKRSEVEKDW
jgi:tetratricopeptide (TPR) repeat protein